MSTTEKIFERNEKFDYLKIKTKRKTKSSLIREIKNLKNYFDADNNPKKIKKGNNLPKNQKTNRTSSNIKSRRGRKKKIVQEVNENPNNIQSSNSASITKAKKKIPNSAKSLISNCHKYFFINSPNEYYFSLNDILLFLKISFGIDYENYILKDEQKQEFKVKLDNFLKDYTVIYSTSNILIKESYLILFFDIISKFIDISHEDLTQKFKEISKNFKDKKLKEKLEYIKPVAFVCENLIKIEDINKKKVGHYAKYKTIPKWHHYAWDMINQISNSRKSFIFSQYGIEEGISQEHSKRKLDLATVTLKLKLKIYNNIFEFIDEVMKMIKFSIDTNNRIGNIKNVTFCKMMELRMQKQIKKLKDENKI